MMATSNGQSLRGISGLIADNATSKGMIARGAVGRGGPCSRVFCVRPLRHKLHVAFGSSSGEAGRYHCQGLTWTVVASDASPLAACASIRRSALRSCGCQALRRRSGLERGGYPDRGSGGEHGQMEFALQHARYEASHAQAPVRCGGSRQWPGRRQLERRWNETLMAVRNLEDRLEAIPTQKQPALSDADENGLCSRR